MIDPIAAVLFVILLIALVVAIYQEISRPIDPYADEVDKDEIMARIAEKLRNSNP